MNSVSREIQTIRQNLRSMVELLETKFPFAQAFFSEQEGLSVQVLEREVKTSAFPSRRGAVLSVFNGEHLVEIATSDLSLDSLQRHSKKLLEDYPVMMKTMKFDPGDPWEEDYFSSYRINPFEIPLKDKLDKLGDIRIKTAGLNKRIVTSAVRYGEKIFRKIYVNRNKSLFQELLQTVCVPVVIVSDGKKSKMMRTGNGRQVGFEICDIPEKDLNEMVGDAIKMLEAKPVPPGIYNIISGPGLSGVLAHEAFGHGVEADMFIKKRAKAVEFMDREVASPLVNLFDNPAWPGESGSYRFDDEGMQSSETRIIENGILRRALTDQRSASLLKISGTANGRRESFAHKAYARMSNTYFGAGKSNLNQMLDRMEYGLYMPRSSNGMEDPKNWGIQVESPFAVEINKGKPTGKIFAPAVVTGFVPDLLKSISMVGDCIEFEGMGICQKGHKEQVPVAIGGPHLMMRALVG